MSGYTACPEDRREGEERGGKGRGERGGKGRGKRGGKGRRGEAGEKRREEEGRRGLCRTHRMHQPHTHFTHPHSSTHSCAHIDHMDMSTTPIAQHGTTHWLFPIPSTTFIPLLHTLSHPHHHSCHSSLHLLPHNTPSHLSHHTLLTPYSLTSHLFHSHHFHYHLPPPFCLSFASLLTPLLPLTLPPFFELCPAPLSLQCWKASFKMSDTNF